MAVYTHVSAEALRDFLTRYEVGELVSFRGIPEGVENSNYIVDTTKARFFLTLYEKRVAASDLPYFMALLDHLAAKGLPVPPAIKDRTGVEIQELAGRPACLIKFLPGLAVSKPTPSQAHAVGAALGRMHRALEDFTLDRPNALGPSGWNDLAARLGGRLDEIGAGLSARIAAELDLLPIDWPSDLPRSAIHADLFPDNVLMCGDKVGGLIDFYFACTEIRAWDVAVTHVAWSFDASNRYQPDIGDALIAGYDETHGLSDAERAAFAVLARGACLRFLLTRAWDWLNTPADAMVTRKDPLLFLTCLDHYHAAA